MAEKISSLNIGLLENGAHSLKRGYEIWKEWDTTKEHWYLKESVIWVHHGIELLLKQLLVQSNEFLLFSDVDKAVKKLSNLRKKKGMENAGTLELFENDDSAISVGFSNLIERAAVALLINELSKGEELRNLIDNLTKYRNKIVHFSVEIDVGEISSLLYSIAKPLLKLLSREVNDHNFKHVIIPDIQRSLAPIKNYINHIQEEAAYNAAVLTRNCIDNPHKNKIGIIHQVSGTGMSHTLASYLYSVTRLINTPNLSIIILTDRKDIAQQIGQRLSDSFIVRDFTMKNNIKTNEPPTQKKTITITTVQKLIHNNVKLDGNTLLIGYNLNSIPKKFEHLLSNTSKILFSSIFSDNLSKFFGTIISKYSYQQAIQESILLPIAVTTYDIQDDENAKSYTDLLLTISKAIISDIEDDELGYKAIVIVKDKASSELLMNEISNLSSQWKNENRKSLFVSSSSSANNADQVRSVINDFDRELHTHAILIGTGQSIAGNPQIRADRAYLSCCVSPATQQKVIEKISGVKEGKYYAQVIDFAGSDWSKIVQDSYPTPMNLFNQHGCLD
ncbi:DEAD/DEAH box helicase family protein [Vibrio astriarenae]